MAKITYEDKEFLNKNENIADKNKVNDTDLNQIKEVVNNTFYADYSNNNVVSDANTATETGGYYTLSTTTNLPINGSAGYLNVMKRNDDVITQFWTRYSNNELYIRQKNIIEPSGWKAWEQIKTIGSDIVYDKTLESAQSSVSIPCDILADGGAYEFSFIISPNNTSAVSDYKMYFNDDDSLQYAENMFGATGNLTAEGSLTQMANYRGYQKLIGDYWGSSIDSKVPVILEGRIRLVDNVSESGKKIFVATKFSKIMHQSQCLMYHIAISTSNITNVNKINLTQQNTSVANYGTGSRFILKKI